MPILVDVFFCAFRKEPEKTYDGFPLSAVSSSAFRIAKLTFNRSHFLTGLAEGELVDVRSDADRLVDGPLSGGSSNVVCGGVDGGVYASDRLDNLLPKTPSLSVSSSKVSSSFASDMISTSEARV